MNKKFARLCQWNQPVRWWTGIMLTGVLAFGAMACWFIFQHQHQQRMLRCRIALSAGLTVLSTHLDQLDNSRALYRQQQSPTALADAISKADQAAMTARALRDNLLSVPAGLACIDRVIAHIGEPPRAVPDASALALKTVARDCMAALTSQARSTGKPEPTSLPEAHERFQHMYGAVLGMSAGILLLTLLGWRMLQTLQRKEQAALLAEQRYRQLFDDAINGMAIVDVGGRVLKANRSYAQMLGYAEHELTGVEFLSLKHPADRDEARGSIGEVVREQRSSGSRERRYRHRSGAIVWARSSLSVLAGTSGADCRVLVVAEDITAEKIRDDRLRRSEMRFRGIARVSNDAFWEWDAVSGEVWRSDDDSRPLRGASRAAHVQDAFWIAGIHPEERETVRSSIADAIASGAAEWSGEYRYRRADGSYGYLLDRATIMRDSDDKVLRVVGGMLDITGRRRVQQAVMQMAASVPSNTPADFFDLLLRNLVRALDADGGAIARIKDHDPEHARTIAAVVNGVSLPCVTYRFADTPCIGLLQERECIVPGELQSLYPSGGRLGDLVAEAYAAASLVDSEGRVLGAIFVLYREALTDDELIRPVLRIFAERATAEIGRLDTLLQLREKAELLNHAQEAIAVLDLGLRVCFWNPGAARVYQLPAEQALGASVHAHYVKADALSAALACVLEKGEWCGEFSQLRCNGEQFMVEERWSLVRNELGEPHSILRVGNDVSERKRQEEQIRSLAYYDTLTGLPNRRLLLERLQLAQARTKRLRRHAALLFLDMDNFKGINDTHGHHIGDMFLCSAAQRLASCVRAADTVARLGGDEFVVLLEDLDADPDVAATQVESVAQQLVTRLGEPMPLGEVHWRATASIGVVTFGPDPLAIEALMQRADRAMYAAKAAGRDTVRFAESTERG